MTASPATARAPGAASPPVAAARRLVLLEVFVLAASALGVAAWFAGVPAVPPWAPLSAAALGAAVRLALTRPRLPRPRLETALCLAAAVVYRSPALLHPWGWVNRDGAYGAFVALHLLQGARPAPAFTEGANYQGTLKAHIAAGLARLTGIDDLSLLMTVASLLLYLVFVAATMALARRLAGPVAAAAAGLYLAVGPRFLTVFSLNCVGQYVDVLALGGLALAMLARILDEDRTGRAARVDYLVVGLLVGAAFWQQPVAAAYVLVVAATLALRRASYRDPWTLLVPAGLLLGALPVILWNVQNGWASMDVLGRDPSELKAQADALPRLVRRTVTTSFPILAGLSPGHPWAGLPLLPALASAILPAALFAYLLLHGREALSSAVAGRPSSAALPVVLTAACLGLFWAVAAGRVYWRPRYLLPLLAAAAVHLAVVVAWLWTRSRPVAAAVVGSLLALHLVGTWPRMRESEGIAAYHRAVVSSLLAKGIRAGYADFSIAAPVTMFTAERIVLSPALGPTPAYESPLHARLVRERGPDAFVLRPEDDPERFAEALRRLGVSFRMEREPVPVFFALSRPVAVEEVAGLQTSQAESGVPDE